MTTLALSALFNIRYALEVLSRHRKSPTGAGAREPATCRAWPLRVR
jgi:hypothetical protein